MENKLPPLVIGDLVIPVPIILGGMGVRIGTAELAAAVANNGGGGTIASVGLGYGDPEHEKKYKETSLKGLRNEIAKARSLTKGILGVNIMVALTLYEDLVRTSVEEGVDYIISGAGLPMALPEIVGDSGVKAIPIVSSAKAADLIARSWKKRHDRFPDAYVVEGPEAGGHLGFGFDDLVNHTAQTLEEITEGVLEVTGRIEDEYGVKVPVIPAGGIYTGQDIAKFLKMGVSGVQMATRFVATDECPVADKFKELYLKATPEDIVIIPSPAGMPGRSFRTKLIDKVVSGGKIPVKCTFQCLRTCQPKEVPYCIARALYEAYTGNVDEAVVFCGSNAYRIDRIMPVKELMDSLVLEAVEELAKS